MRAFPNHEEVQGTGCLAIANLVLKCVEARTRLQSLGGLELYSRARSLFPHNHLAKSAERIQSMW